MQQFDVLIIGSGLAGLTVALKVAAKKKVCLVSKRKINDNSSSWAQVGIAAVLIGKEQRAAGIPVLQQGIQLHRGQQFRERRAGALFGGLGQDRGRAF